MSDPFDLARPLLWLLRLLWSAAWEWTFQAVGWWLGWPFWRLVSLGRFPEAPFLQPVDDSRDDVPFATAVIVDVTGIVVLGGMPWLLSGSA